MFNRAKVTGLVISVMTVFFIIGCGVSLPPADSSASQPVEQPEKVSQDKASEKELLAQTSLNLSDSAETSSGVASADVNRDPAPIVENKGTSSEQLLEYLRWKHNAIPAQENEAAETARLLEYLRWKHNAGLSLQEGATIAPETGVSLPLSSENQLRAYLYWAHMRED